MARVFVTGSTEGLGRATALTLLRQRHQVVLHARNGDRAFALTALADQGAEVVIGDLANQHEVHELAEQVNRLGPMDAVVHNAGVYADRQRSLSPEGYPRVIAVNVIAPYLLTALINPPDRLIYLSSDMHPGGHPSVVDLEWAARRWSPVQAYRDSKLLVTALAFAAARRWPQVRSNAVDPGWVPTRMGGPGAPDDLELGHLTQVWLATSADPAAATTGAYWHHQRRLTPAAAATDPQFQDQLVDALALMTGVQFGGISLAR